MGKQTTTPEDMKLVHPHAAGLDIGAEEIWACVPPSSTTEPVQRFGTFTPDLKSLTNWLLNHQVDTVALESTGVYWIPVFEMLEAAGLKVSGEMALSVLAYNLKQAMKILGVEKLIAAVT